MLTLLALCAMTGASTARGQGGPLGADASIPPTPFPVGSGARAAGMANAFVAIADDATAASWNPAGLVQLERPELSLVGEALWTKDRFQSWREPEFDGAHTFNEQSVNFMSFVYPIQRPLWGRNIVLSLSYQRRYDFRRRFSGSLNTVQGAPGGLVLQQNAFLDFDQDGSLGTMTPAIAFELTNTLSLGVAVNFWRDTWFDDGGWEQTTRVNGRFNAGPSVSFSRGYSRERYEDFRGEHVTLGALWRANDRWTIGLRYESKLHGKADYRAVDREIRIVPNPLRPITVNARHVREQREVNFPDAWTLGVSYRRNDRLTLAMDISRTDWDDLSVKTDEGVRRSLIDGADLGDPFTRTNFDPTWAVRLGGEYVFIPKQRGETLDMLWSLRGGLFFEQEPASGRSTRSPFRPGDGDPDDFYGVTLGVGVLVKQRLNLDLAYQYRWGNNVNGDLNPGLTGFSADERRHRFLFSTVLYF
jgi:long-subunit fatty acid transport protein